MGLWVGGSVCGDQWGSVGALCSLMYIVRVLLVGRVSRGKKLGINTACVDRVPIDHPLQGAPVAVRVVRAVRAVETTLLDLFTCCQLGQGRDGHRH